MEQPRLDYWMCLQNIDCLVKYTSYCTLITCAISDKKSDKRNLTVPKGHIDKLIRDAYMPKVLII